MEATIIVILSIIILLSVLMIISLTVMASRTSRLEENAENERMFKEFFSNGESSNNYNKDGNEV